ncbi:hypothetical protein LCGC14_1778880 [marine sediment metagenome]|uniref:Uncharacterized protein n=1 Tax=marine sediment metagenome TaxID=412755 RepID=A0A0F9GVX8_9ZZZZ
MEATPGIEAMIVVPRTFTWVEISLILWLNELVWAPDPTREEPSKGIVHYLTTGNRK